MTPLRFDDGGRARLGVANESGVVPLDAIAGRYPTMLSLIAGGDEALRAVREAVDRANGALDLGPLRLLAPIERPGKFLAIGMSYKKHVAEAQKLGIAVPAHQILVQQTNQLHRRAVRRGRAGRDRAARLRGRAGGGTRQSGDERRDRGCRGTRFRLDRVQRRDVSARDWQKHRRPLLSANRSTRTG